MSLESKIKDMFDASAAIQQLVNDRYYPNVLKQGVPVPAIVYTVVTDKSSNVIDGSRPTISKGWVQIDCYALHFDDAQAVADAVVELFGCRTEVGFASIEIDSGSSYEDATLYHRVRKDFSVWRNV